MSAALRQDGHEPALLEQAEWVRQHGVVLGGLDWARRREDGFDALLSAAALLRCVLEGTPLDSAGTHPMEGGILGTESLNLKLRERRLGIGAMRPEFK